jgi:hypothetical protein
MWGNIAAKQKLYRGNIVTIHIVFFLNTKLNFQPTYYKKNKIYKDYFKKKE